mgnify:CR=1 FL=1
MAYTTIDDPSAHFQTALYTGTGSNQSITNGGNSDLQPDLVWVKDRGATNDHKITDSSRLSSGNPTITLESNTNNAEYDDADPAATTSFNSDGFTIGTNGNYNTNTNTYVAWQWKANGGTTSSNTTGDITTTVQANTTAGFSIMTWTSNNADNQTLGHGLGAAPEVFWVKLRNATGSWYCYHKGAAATHYISLNSDGAKVDNVIWGDTAPTSSVITVDTNSVSGSTPTALTYAWKEIQGYSKFGSYTGNGNANGTFVYTGFKPAWLMVKNIDTAGENWHIFDNKRATSNVIKARLIADGNSTENTNDSIIDFTSNGFKWRMNNAGFNGSGDDYIYMAFAEHPFVSSKGVPVTAR